MSIVFRIACAAAGTTACVAPALAVPAAQPAPAPAPAAPSASAPSASAPAPAPAAQQPMAVVEVTEHYDPRSEDTATKHVVRAEELSKYGDTNILEALRRVPGVSVNGAGGVSMRGLGSRYTQLLVNGGKPPPGFMLAALSPDQVERIEVMRSATAEHSMQAVAGTINIVLRRKIVNGSTSAKLHTVRSKSAAGYIASGATSGKFGAFSYLIDARYSRSDNAIDSDSVDQLLSPDGAVAAERVALSKIKASSDGYTLMPRLTWSPDASRELVAQYIYQTQDGANTSQTGRAAETGAFPAGDWTGASGSGRNDEVVQGVGLDWTQALLGGTLTAKFSSSWHKQSNLTDTTLVIDAGSAAPQGRLAQSRLEGKRTDLSAKFERRLSPSHLLTVGAAYLLQDSREARHRRETSGALLVRDSTDYFDGSVETSSAFLQDEWKASEALSVYAGLRWEKIGTSSLSRPGAAVHADNAIFTPVAQTLYKLPGRKGEQLRAALSRTFKAPSLDELTARRIEAVVNTRFTPDSAGNPVLVPEVADGVDLTYEKYGAGGAFFTLGAGVRHIRHHLRHQLYLAPDGRWLQTTLNSGSVNLRNLDADMRFPGSLLDPRLKPYTARLSVTRNWSELVGLPGPHNTLPSAPLSVTLGLDYKRGRLSTGASLVHRQGYRARVSEMETRQARERLVADVFALWRQTPTIQWRFSLNDIRSHETPTVKEYQGADGISRQWSRQPMGVRGGLNLEMKF